MGTQVRPVTCVDQRTSTTVSPGNCTTPAPASSRSCDSGVVCTYVWNVTDWGTCSMLCHSSGNQSRTVKCKDRNGADVDDSLCANSGSRPASTQSCNTAACVWQSGDYGACSQRCTYTTNNALPFQNRSVVCYNPNLARTESDESLCSSGAVKPESSRTCNTGYCSWLADPWSGCSKECGNGTQSRAVCCRDSNANNGQGECLTDGTLIASACGGSPPISQQACNVKPCYWSTGSFSDCSVPCGGGFQSRTVTCMNPHTLAAAVNQASACAGLVKPAESIECNSFACATPYWLPGAWSTCSLTCGAGVRTRAVTCVVGAAALPVNDPSQCSTASRPATSEACGKPCNPCSSNADPVVNCGLQGTCVPKADSPLVAECKCSEGWAGPTCNIAPTLKFTAPNANGAMMLNIGATPSAVGTFAVNVTGTASSVTLVLHKGSDCARLWNPATTFCLPVAVVATSVPLTVIDATRFVSQATYQWTLPTSSPTGPFVAGADYYVRAYALGSTFDDSPLITFSECDSTPSRSCLNGGTCDNGRCLCSAGFSGQRCSQASNVCARLTPCGTNGACQSTGDNAFICTCSGGFSGQFCQLAPSCTLQCANGGRPNSDCTACLCNRDPTVSVTEPTLWSGANCQTCPLTCQNGGKANTQCTRCVCPAGFSGTQCTRVASNVRFRVTIAFSTVAATVGALRFEEALAADLSRSLRVPKDRFQVLKLSTGSVIVDLQISSPQPPEAASAAFPNANMTATQLTTLFKEMTSSSRSDIFSGSVLQELDPAYGYVFCRRLTCLRGFGLSCSPACRTCLFVSFDCSVVTDSPSGSGGGGGTNMALIIGVVVGVVCVAIFIAVAVVMYKRYVILVPRCTFHTGYLG